MARLACLLVWLLIDSKCCVLQAGAKHVYAVEASDMAHYARKLIAGNQPYGQRITVLFFPCVCDFCITFCVQNSEVVHCFRLIALRQSFFWVLI
jgi:hypothetical protein